MCISQSEALADPQPAVLLAPVLPQSLSLPLPLAGQVAVISSSVIMYLCDCPPPGGESMITQYVLYRGAWAGPPGPTAPTCHVQNQVATCRCFPEERAQSLGFQDVATPFAGAKVFILPLGPPL